MARMILIHGQRRSLHWIDLRDVNTWIRWAQEHGFGIEVTWMHA